MSDKVQRMLDAIEDYLLSLDYNVETLPQPEVSVVGEAAMEILYFFDKDRFEKVDKTLTDMVYEANKDHPLIDVVYETYKQQK